jgi:hypothetical protein
MRSFAGLELNAIADETTILNFRHLLERHALTTAVFVAVADHRRAKGELLRGGPIVDANQGKSIMVISIRAHGAAASHAHRPSTTWDQGTADDLAISRHAEARIRTARAAAKRS